MNIKQLAKLIAIIMIISIVMCSSFNCTNNNQIDETPEIKVTKEKSTTGGDDQVKESEQTPKNTTESKATNNPESSQLYEVILQVGEARVGVGETVNIDIFIDGAEESVSGIDITILLTDEDVAQITNITLLDFGLEDISEFPATVALIMAADINDVLPSSTKKTKLATISIKGISQGRSDLEIKVNAIDDDNGNPIIPIVTNGSVTVISSQ